MRQGYSYISDLSEAAQKNIYALAKRYSDFTESEVKSIILGSPDKRYCVAGRLFNVGEPIGTECNPNLVGLMFALNRVVYHPEFDSEKAIAYSRGMFHYGLNAYSTRDGLLAVLEHVQKNYKFSMDVRPAGEQHEIDTLVLSGERRQFALTLKSRDYTGNGNIARVTRIITMDHKGLITFKGEKSLQVFDNILTVALVTGWAEDRIKL